MPVVAMFFTGMRSPLAALRVGTNPKWYRSPTAHIDNSPHLKGGGIFRSESYRTGTREEDAQEPCPLGARVDARTSMEIIVA